MVFLYRYFSSRWHFHSPFPKQERNFPDSHCQNLTELLEVKLTEECGLGRSGVFDSQASPQPASRKSLIPVGYSYSGVGSRGSVCSGRFWLYLRAWSFNFEASSLPDLLTPLKGLRRVDVSVCPGFFTCSYDKAVTSGLHARWDTESPKPAF